jgi:hypothetical protein
MRRLVQETSIVSNDLLSQFMNMKLHFFLLSMLTSLTLSLFSQTVEITGQTKITQMSSTVSAAGNVVRQDDGMLALRQFEVGDFAHGGIVFWVDESGEHGLVCAKTDQSANIRWHAGSVVTTQAKGDGPFSGEMNTMIAISSHAGTSDDGAAYAARLCAELIVTENGSSYGDWYLPSKAELNLMHLNAGTIDDTALENAGTAFVAFASYWSSTEASNSNAWSQNITLGTQSSTSKSSNLDVRAIRAF